MVVRRRRKHTDLTGQKFGKLRAISYEQGLWVCHCECGEETRVNITDLQWGRITRCRKCKSQHYGKDHNVITAEQRRERAWIYISFQERDKLDIAASIGDCYGRTVN